MRYFLAVAAEENMTAAANSLHISQPALSYQISELEKELGRQLFVRSGRRMILSEEGMYLRQRAQEIVSLAERTKAEMSRDEAEVYGDIYIGAAESISLHFLAEIISQFRQEYPHVIFHFHSGNLDEVSDRMNTGTIDFAVVVEPFSLEGCLSIPLPSRDRMGIAVPRSHPLADRESVSAEDLYDQPLIITLRRSMSPESYARMLEIPAERLNIAATGNLIFNMAILAEHGIGVIVTLEGLIGDYENSSLKFIPLAPERSRKLAFAYKQYRPLSKAAGLFLEKVKAGFDSAAA